MDKKVLGGLYCLVYLVTMLNAYFVNLFRYKP